MCGKIGNLGIHMFSTVYVQNAKKLALASAKTQSPPQITNGFYGNTAKFYFVISKDYVSKR